MDPKNGAGVTKGNVWWFTTGTLVPPPEEETPLPSLSWVRTPGSRNLNHRSLIYCMLYTIRVCIRDEVVGKPIEDYPSSISSSIDFPAAEPSSGPPLAYSLRPEIPGLVFNQVLRTLRGTPAPGAAGAYNMTYTAEDADGRTIQFTFIMYIKKCGTCSWPPLRTPEEETPPEPRQAPAWPAAAADFKIEGESHTSCFTIRVVAGRQQRVVADRPTCRQKVPPPTGNPKPVISVKGAWPAALEGSLQELHFYPAYTLAAKGTLTLVASNFAGSAELKVPYNITCRYTLAETLERNRGSWVPWGTPGKYSSLTIGDTVTTVPASSDGALHQDLTSYFTLRGRLQYLSNYRGHTRCGSIFHADYGLGRDVGSWNKDKYPTVEQVGCERLLYIHPIEGKGGHFRPAGCESGNSPDGTPD